MMKNGQLIILPNFNKVKNLLSLFTATAHGMEDDIHVSLDTKYFFFHCTTLMEKEAGAKNNNSEKRICFCLAAENLLHKKYNSLSEFIYYMCHLTYTKDALVLCRLKLLNMELSEICDIFFD